MSLLPTTDELSLDTHSRHTRPIILQLKYLSSTVSRPLFVSSYANDKTQPPSPLPRSHAGSDPFIKDELLSPYRTNAFDNTKPLPEGWKICTHPQVGWIYFVNPNLKFVTDHDIRDQEVYALIMRDADKDYSLEDSMEIHLFAYGLSEETTEGNWTNFLLFIDHSRCLAFYEDELEATHRKDIEVDPTRMNRRSRLYWNYVWNHPTHIPTPKLASTEALDALTWFYTDNLISSHKSTVPFSKSECEDLLRIVHQLSDSSYGHAPARTVFLAWILRESYKYRDAERHGQRTVKDFVEYQRSKLPQPEPTSLPSLPASLVQFLVIRCLFFGIPNTYYLHIKLTSEYRGRLASVQHNWESYVDRLVREYSHFLLISTVLLSATIGFLSAPNLPEASVLTAVASALTSLGSIIIGVFSMWTHQAKTQKGNFFTYLYNAKHSYFGFLGHALMLSLPPVLLVWAILAFTISLVTYVMQGVGDTDVANRISAWSILIVCIVLSVVVVSALYTFSMVWKFRQRTNSLYYRVKNMWTKGYSAV